MNPDDPKRYQKLASTLRFSLDELKVHIATVEAEANPQVEADELENDKIRARQLEEALNQWDRLSASLRPH